MPEVPDQVQIAVLKSELKHLSEEVADMRSDITQLVAAWNTATNFVSFVKWLSGAVTAVGATWLVFRAKIGL